MKLHSDRRKKRLGLPESPSPHVSASPGPRVPKSQSPLVPRSPRLPVSGSAGPDVPAPQVVMCWSGGKDSCLALFELKHTMNYTIAALLTTVTADYDRISMHGVRRVLLERQAASLGLPLRQLLIPKDASNEEYESGMTEALESFREQGINSIVFGDLFLEDVRTYRENFLARICMNGLFPVWHRNTSDFIRDFISLGFKAVVTCVNGDILPESFAGRNIDLDFLQALPVGVDPCGENGEFHSFVFDGPMFAKPVEFSLGETVKRGPFWFRDLIPA